jgi:hypothetical protein
VLWGEFVAHAEARCKDKLIAAFRKPVLWCVGTHHGAPCPQEFEVDLTTTCTFAALNHEQDVAVTCDMWVCAIAAMPRGPWSMGRRRRRRSAAPPALRRHVPMPMPMLIYLCLYAYAYACAYAYAHAYAYATCSSASYAYAYAYAYAHAHAYATCSSASYAYAYAYAYASASATCSSASSPTWCTALRCCFCCRAAPCHMLNTCCTTAICAMWPCVTQRGLAVGADGAAPQSG